MKNSNVFYRMRQWLFLVLPITILIAISCTGQQCTYCNSDLQGDVQNHIQADFDTTIRYSIYIPESTGDAKLPLLVLFDAHGNTVPALEMYKTLADKYKFAMAGFETSENGVPFEQFSRKFKPWLSELADIAPIDTSMLFLSGFSGGARVASLFDNFISHVKGIALCGAGPANQQTWVKSETPYMAFCGSGDFNYLELMSLQSQVSKMKTLPITVFIGKHEWPPAEIFADFFVLMNRIANGISENSEAENEIISRCKTFVNAGRPDLAIYSASGGIFALKAENAKQLSSFADSVEKSISQEFISEYNAVLKSEIRLQSQVRNIFQKADTTQLTYFLDSLKGETSSDTISLEYDLASRLKAYCGIVAYSYSSKAFKSKSADLYKQLRLYQIVESDNNEMFFLFSAYYAERNDCEKAQEFLSKAKENGFSDKVRYNNTREFNGCRNGLKF